jgi:hypothetical protein
LQALNFLFVGRQNLGRQTDGLGFIVSGGAITKMNYHCKFSDVEVLVERVANLSMRVTSSLDSCMDWCSGLDGVSASGANYTV